MQSVCLSQLGLCCVKFVQATVLQDMECVQGQGQDCQRQVNSGAKVNYKSCGQDSRGPLGTRGAHARRGARQWQ
ncbi:hypothetical protein B0F90DRAFT_1772964 [Multifurca ochricompacta]|uniref:Secreted protein n=1 Tax=Multifurca ochricompacta TaxID=376703 RepID=A0AAD4QJH2_9AGAM|nr:hypothetical protein B0F90DRAFT_1772964 [Multifurca ochricompacta]